MTSCARRSAAPPGPANGFLLVSLSRAELRQSPIISGGRKILGTQGNARVDVAFLFGKEVEYPHRMGMVPNGSTQGAGLAATGAAFPSLRRPGAYIRQAHRRPARRHRCLRRDGMPHRNFRGHRARGRAQSALGRTTRVAARWISRTRISSAATWPALSMVSSPSIDPAHRLMDKTERQTGASDRYELGDGVEHDVGPHGPARHFAIAQIVVLQRFA